MKQLRITMIALCLASAGYAFSSPFEILVTETSFGSNPNPANWGGIQRYGFSGNGASATTLTGISAGSLSDPAGMFFNGTELFVGNRHGNGSPSSVSRFLYDSGTSTFSANGTITGNGMVGVHGLAMRPGTNELYASNVNNGLSAFTVTGGGATAMGMLLSGAKRDVFFSADGANMYATEGINGNLVRYEFATSTVTTYAISGASGLHFGNWRGDHLFLGDYSGSKVYDITFDANGAVSGSTVAANLNAAIGVAFSPDNQEMFVSSHTGNSITRYTFNSGTSAWDMTGTINTDTNMGDIQVIASVPEPASMAALGLGALALLRRRRKN